MHFVTCHVLIILRSHPSVGCLPLRLTWRICPQCDRLLYQVRHSTLVLRYVKSDRCSCVWTASCRVSSPVLVLAFINCTCPDGSLITIYHYYIYRYYKRLKSILIMCEKGYVYFTAVRPQSSQTVVMISGWLCCEVLILIVHWCDGELPQLSPTCTLTCANVSSLCPTIRRYSMVGVSMLIFSLMGCLISY